MESIVITVDPSNPRKKLGLVAVGKGSALYAEIVGIPIEISDVEIHFRDADASTYASFACEALPQSRWLANVPCVPYSDIKDYQYHLTGRDEKGQIQWLGFGVFRVMPTFIPVSGAPVPDAGGHAIFADGIYIKNRSTGKYQLMQFENDEDGEPIPVWSTEGVEK